MILIMYLVCFLFLINALADLQSRITGLSRETLPSPALAYGRY